MIPAPFKSAVERIVGKTYQEHALGERPFGFDEDKGSCSYAAGCAIGISLTPETARDADFARITTITTWLKEGGPVCNELFSSPEPVTDASVVACLCDIQAYHDIAARTENRSLYRRQLEYVARLYGLELPAATP